MESIRPDDDELREGRRESLSARPEAGDAVRASGKARQAASVPVAGGAGTGSKGGGSEGVPGGGSGGSGRAGGVWLLALLLILAVAGGGVVIWQLHQQVTRLDMQLQDADQWVRQSRLALARFEGELSETGETLEQRGTSLADNITTLTSDIETVQGEIRKLWVLANERNRPQIERLGGELSELTEASAALADALESLDTRLTETGDGLRAELQQALATQSEQLEQQVADLAEEQALLASQVGEVVTTTEQTLERRLQRFSQEQKLTLDGLDGRVTVLERSGNELEPIQRQLAETRRRLAEAEQVLKAVDASRAQLTSRLVRLQEQVDSLE